MLTLTRRENETIKIGENITILIQQTTSGQVRLSIDAPKEVPIIRDNAKVKSPKR